MKQKVIDFFQSDKHVVGSKERLKALLKNFPRNKFLVAGSWGIELLTGVRFQHTDIDLILLQEKPVYIDDAQVIEEKCLGEIPLKKAFLEKTALVVYDRNILIKVPCLEVQIAFKILGELDKKYSPQAIKQLFALFAVDKKVNEELMRKVYRSTLPETLNSLELSEQTLNCMKLFRENCLEKAEREIIKLHRKINLALKNEFKQLKT